jgi:hypothetical protein
MTKTATIIPSKEVGRKLLELKEYLDKLNITIKESKNAQKCTKKCLDLTEEFNFLTDKK